MRAPEVQEKFKERAEEIIAPGRGGFRRNDGRTLPLLDSLPIRSRRSSAVSCCWRTLLPSMTFRSICTWTRCRRTCRCPPFEIAAEPCAFPREHSGIRTAGVAQPSCESRVGAPGLGQYRIPHAPNHAAPACRASQPLHGNKVDPVDVARIRRSPMAIRAR